MGGKGDRGEIVGDGNRGRLHCPDLEVEGRPFLISYVSVGWREGGY